MIITMKCLKTTVNCYHPLSIAAKTWVRSSSCLTVPGVHRFPSALPVKKGWLHTSSCNQFPGKDWRKMQGQPANPNSYGPLTDGPDYSYLDGRPTPIGGGKLKRAKEQKEITSKIMKLNAEVDFAVANYEAKVQNEKQRRAEIVQNKLKPKGRIPPEVIS